MEQPRSSKSEIGFSTLRIDLMKKIKMLAVNEDKRINDLLEEAIIDLLKKYKIKLE